MTGWPRWDRAAAPGALTQYVQRSAVARVLPGELAARLPGPGDGPPLDRARRIYEVLADCGVRYVDESTESGPGRQAIRTPDQALSGPRQATCLDLAVTFAGACLDAGLHPVILVLDPVRPSDPAHAVVAVWLGGQWEGRPSLDYPLTEKVDRVPPDELVGEVCAGAGEPGAFAVIDVAAAARRFTAQGESAGEPAPWSRALAEGARMLADAVVQAPDAEPQWQWGTGIDVGLVWNASDVLDVPGWPGRDPLITAYLGPDPQGRPLDQVRARRGLVPFYGRDELDVLLDWCQAPDPQGPMTRIALVNGVGGSGKTHLAAELCARLSRIGWYTGFLPRDPDPGDLAWLGTVVSPLLVVMDYAEAAKSADVRNLVRAVWDRSEPTCLALTARAISGWWDEELAPDLQEEGHAFTLLSLRLPDLHPRTTGVFRTALRAFSAVAEPSSPAGAADAVRVVDETRPPSGRWTTLDLIMLAWLAARGTGQLPASQTELYEEILGHEFRYWRRTFRERYGSRPPQQVLRAAGACVTLLAPVADRVEGSLAAVMQLADDGSGWRRSELAELLRDLLNDPGDDTVVVRPDPVGDHLMLTVLGADLQLFERCLKQASSAEQLRGCIAITRAAQEDAGTARRLASIALNVRPGLWQPALRVAGSQGGPFTEALEQLADRDDSPLPLERLDAEIPAGHVTLSGLALVAAREITRRLGNITEPSAEDRTRYAGAVNSLAIRLGDAGRREEALGAAEEAVTIRRDLARANLAAHLPDLAGSVNNLAIRLTGAGRREEALAAAEEAVGLYRDLAQANPAAYVPDLATSVNNLANHLAGAGRREEALAAAEEAVTIRRDLARANPAANLPGLAGSVNNLANRLGDTGRREEALAAAEEAARLYRDLACANPAANLPGLARSVNNLANHLAGAGRREEALAAAEEAARLYRDLARANPAAYLPDLAGSVNNLANRLADTGRREEALAAAEEAARLYRDLARANPAAYLPNLATSVSNLAIRLADGGRREEALAAAEEAVGLYRDLTRANLAAYLPDLAMSVNNLANRLGDAGRREEALGAAEEAVTIRRDLTRANLAAHLPDLAGSVNNLANRLADTGRREEALAAAEEAAGLYRDLAQANPAAYVPDLATSVNNLANHLAGAGRREEALAAAGEAAGLYRDLARANLAAYLPDLAMSVNNLANRLGDAGRREEALAAAGEAAGLYRDLAQANPAAYLPDLAMSVNNLANRLGDAGRREEALAAAGEAAGLYRDLAQANPAAYLPNLAMSVNNLANDLAGAGRREEALATAEEAARLYRDLAQANPAVYLPGLAGSVNNLAVRLADAGRHEEALAAAEEAVTIRRDLAQANPAVYLPELAMSVNNLAVRLAGAGRHEEALAAAEEAARLYRDLAQVDPAVYLPNLATSVNNLATHLADAGRHEEALATAEEAARLYRDLAQANPAAYLPNLATSVNNLANHLADAGRHEEALAVFEAAAEPLRDGAKAELLVSRFAWRVRHSDHAATGDLRLASDFASAETEPIWTGRGRRAVRAAAAESGELSGLPAWVTAELPESAVQKLKAWLSADGWPQQREFLRASSAEFLTQEGQAVLTLVGILYPELTKLSELSRMLDQIAARSLDVVLDELDELHCLLGLVRDWLDTGTWTESQDFLAAHPELITDSRILDLLRVNDNDPEMARHEAIIVLCQRKQIAEVYDLVTDVTMAVDAAMAAMEAGDRANLAAVWTAAPELARIPFAAPYLGAMHLILGEHGEGSEDAERTDLAQLMQLAAEQGTATQRAAGAARLRRLVRSQPAHAEVLGQLAEILLTGPTPADASAASDA